MQSLHQEQQSSDNDRRLCIAGSRLHITPLPPRTTRRASVRADPAVVLLPACHGSETWGPACLMGVTPWHAPPAVGVKQIELGVGANAVRVADDAGPITRLMTL